MFPLGQSPRAGFLFQQLTVKTSLEATTSLWRTLTAAPILLPTGLESKYSADLASLTLSVFPSIRMDLST